MNVNITKLRVYTYIDISPFPFGYGESSKPVVSSSPMFTVPFVNLSTPRLRDIGD
jgi:hypothetical protein